MKDDVVTYDSKNLGRDALMGADGGVPRRARSLLGGTEAVEAFSLQEVQAAVVTLAGVSMGAVCKLYSDRSAAWNAIYPAGSDNRMRRRGARILRKFSPHAGPEICCHAKH